MPLFASVPLRSWRQTAAARSRERNTAFAGFSLALRVETAEKAERFFTALSDGGQIQIPLMKTFFAERYGIIVDRFGISWKIMA